MNNGRFNNTDELLQKILTTSDAAVKIKIRKKNSAGQCDVKAIEEIKLQLEINDEPLPVVPVSVLYAIKDNSHLEVDDVVVTTTEKQALGERSSIPKGVFLTILKTDGDKIFVQYFEDEGWIPKSSVKHSPFDPEEIKDSKVKY